MSDGPRFAISIDLDDPATPIDLPRHGVAIVTATFSRRLGDPDETRAIGCVHDLRVGHGKLSGLVDLRGDNVPQVERVLADYFEDYEPRLLAQFAPPLGRPARRRLLAFRHIGIDAPDTGPLTLISASGARDPKYYEAAYARSIPAIPPPPTLPDLEPIWINRFGRRQRLA